MKRDHDASGKWHRHIQRLREKTNVQRELDTSQKWSKLNQGREGLRSSLGSDNLYVQVMRTTSVVSKDPAEGGCRGALVEVLSPLSREPPCGLSSPGQGWM